MAAGKDGPFAVRLGYLNLPVPNVTIKCGEYGCIFQRVDALFRPREQISLS